MTNKCTKKLKILVSAYACDPNHGSEQGFAWWWVTNCANGHDVTVLTCEAQRPSIEKALESKNTSIIFEYVEGPKMISPSGVEYRFERIKAYLWQIRAILHARRLTKHIKYDLAQHITIGTWRLPSCLAFTDIPFIFGPVSGSERLPSGFSKHLSMRGFIWSTIRSFLIRVAWYDPLILFTLHRARKILVSGPLTYNHLKTKFSDKVEFCGRYFKLPALTQLKESLPQKSHSRKESIQLVWMGQLTPRKGLDLLLRALLDNRLRSCSLDILGDGPEKIRYTKQAQKLNLDKRIRFLGYLERSKALTTLIESDIFVFTSLQDMMGQALSEAMQFGLPCVVMDWSGPGELVGKNGAAKVAVSNFNDTCKNLADTLFLLCCNPELRNQLSRNAINRIRDLTDPVKLTHERDQHFSNVARK